MKKSPVKYARRWLSVGAAIVPLQRRTKVPAKGFSSRAPIVEKAALIAYFHENPDANFGVCCGGPAGLLVVDIDVKNNVDGKATLARLEAQHGALPATVTILTPSGGRHLYFQTTDPRARNSASTIGPGIDVRADGGYAVGPGCRLASAGKSYRYLRGHNLSDIDIAIAPTWLLGLMGAKPMETAAPEQQQEGGDTISEGQRNVTLTSFAGRMHSIGTLRAVTMAATKAQNAAVCRPPLDEAEVETIVNSVTGYSAGASDAGDIGAHLAQGIVDQHFAGGAHLIYAQDGQFWAYNGRLWAPVGVDVIRQHALLLWKQLPKPKPSADTAMRQALSVLSAQVAVADDRLRFSGEPLPVINCANGELWIDPLGTLELRPHQAASYLRTGINVAYDPAATCPRFIKTVSENFAKARNAGSLTSFLFEFIGYVLQPSRQIPTIAIFQGPGRNGKSAIAETITRLLGAELVAAKRIKDLNNSRFSTAELLGKHLLIDDDVQAGLRLPDGDLKRLSEAKLLTGEQKYGRAFQFTARAVPLMLCNGQLSLADLSEGMRRRLLVVPFSRILSEDEIDHDLFPAIWATELPGILNMAMAGWKRVVERGHKFDVPNDVSRKTKDWVRQSNPVPDFVATCCVNEGKETVKTLYAAYGEFCRANGVTLTQQAGQFRRNLELLNFTVKKMNRGATVIGLSLKPS